MNLRIEFSMDNAAFGNGLAESTREAARILREIAENVENYTPYDQFQTIFDANGNDIGRWRIKEQTTEELLERRA